MKKVRKAVFPSPVWAPASCRPPRPAPRRCSRSSTNRSSSTPEEAVAAGITDMIFVTGRSKRAIEDHFDKAYELETELAARGKDEMLEFVRSMIPPGNQLHLHPPGRSPGLGHAVLCAKPVVGDEPFAVLLADDLLDGSPWVMKQMADTYDYYRCSVIGVQDVPRLETKSYGIVKAAPVAERLERIEAIVAETQAGRGAVDPGRGRPLHPDAADIPPPENIGRGSGGEIQLTDGIASLFAEEQVLAYRYAGTRYDCGSKLGYLQATVVFGQRHPEVGEAFTSYLHQQRND